MFGYFLLTVSTNLSCKKVLETFSIFSRVDPSCILLAQLNDYNNRAMRIIRFDMTLLLEMLICRFLHV